MLIEKTPILSICIPTYNRSKFLHSCLLSIFNQLNEDMDVEIIVSNNKSTDDTGEIIKQFVNNSNFRYFEQKENIGVVKNILKLTDEYAKGVFCWIIGDDDFILHGSIALIVDLIKSNADIDYIYAKTKGLDIKDYDNYIQPFNTTNYLQIPLVKEIQHSKILFEKLLDTKYSIIFLGEIMASIFRRKIWVSYDGRFDGEHFETLATTYPHCVIFANKFLKSNAIYIENPVILTLNGAREWWDKLGYILIVHIRELLDLYASKGLSKGILRLCRRRYIAMTWSYFFKFLTTPGAKYREKISFRKYILFLLSNPIQSLRVLSSLTWARAKKAMFQS